MSGRFLPRQAALDSLLTKHRRAVSVGRGFRLTRPHDNPERKIARRFLSGANKSKKPFKAKNPQAMATYVPEVAKTDLQKQVRTVASG